MFKNIGSRIKGLATVQTWLGIIASVFIGFQMFANEDTIILGIVIMVVGSLISWIVSFLLYGFGQLVENSDKLAEKYASDENSQKNDDRMETLKKLLACGLITQEEFNKKYLSMKTTGEAFVDMHPAIEELNRQYESGKISEIEYNIQRQNIIDSL